MDLLTELRAYLIAQAVVRKPSIAGPKPPLWLEPRDGVPAPGEGQNATEIGADTVLGAFKVGGIAQRPYEKFKRLDFVDLRIRTKIAPTAHAIEAQLLTALTDKRGWTMGAMQIIESLLFRPMQPLGSDAQGFDWVIEFSFERYAE